MAQFYRGFVYEVDVNASLTVEGRRVEVPEHAERETEARAWIDRHAAERQAAAQRCLRELKARSRDSWNAYRLENPGLSPMLTDLCLCGMDLSGYDLSYANLTSTRLCGAKLNDANLHQAILADADLSDADLSGANLCRADLYETTLNGATLVKTNLQGVQMTMTKCIFTRFHECRFFGASAWRVEYKPPEGYVPSFVIRHEPSGRAATALTVFDLKVASLLHDALTNTNFGSALSSIRQQCVLLLGRFDAEGKERLEQLRAAFQELNRGYVPIIFDFEMDKDQNLIEVIRLLAELSAFIVADVTSAHAVLQELQAIVPQLSTPVVPIICGEDGPDATFAALRTYPWVLPLRRCSSLNTLTSDLGKWVIEPAKEKRKHLKDGEHDVEVR
ncbi:MAG TPA: pentapeptide repeat-containing protein [Polyangiaceae bacterium]|nr:pentapeptide repeat-containing protein [Polyangiaceae bacterium]